MNGESIGLNELEKKLYKFNIYLKKKLKIMQDSIT